MRTFLAFVTLLALSNEYLPVFMMHGINGSDRSFREAIKVIEKEHPGTIAISIPLNNRLNSYKNLWKQTNELIEFINSTIAKDPEAYKDGYHLIGHSQGGLLTRSLIETWSEHNVKSYISIAGVQNGEYGIPIVPDYDFEEMTVKTITDLMYTDKMQKSFSIANLWRDVDFQNYLAKNTFLPYINNEIEGKQNSTYRDNFLKVEQMVFYGSRDDEVIDPWFSTIFSQYADNSYGEVLGMRNQTFYINDTFGLQTLDKRGNLTIVEVPKVSHVSWHNTTIFSKYVLPYLY